jgi:hypothetical protein
MFDGVVSDITDRLKGFGYQTRIYTSRIFGFFEPRVRAYRREINEEGIKEVK